ncbi:DNA ligase 1 [Spodoptera frugiperda]|uniref:DNA ligase n=1 Tax=Spodoptera frugiperda TaxID=7108 RepID=A0A9R0DSC9_SPOFR|nr:DNA ligase 1 [Spodoptera frugiperda]XP_050552354.1 DNA ligase 1 [Spodoptera frugiperda]XP_050552355.1 DNA ligase 1 [Spodoptera frugiperda]
MNTILKLLVPCRLALQVQQRATRLLPGLLHRVPPNLTYVGTRTMAQRSITSFFKATPPKPVVKEEKSDQDNGIVNGDNSPGSPENGKTKRPRLESSDSDLSPKKQQSPADSKHKKKRVKRQRIESSGSEAEVSLEKDVLVANIMPDTSPSPDKPQIKVEKQSPKTYQSPKSKKKKILTELNNIKKSPSPKKIKKETSKEEAKRKSTGKEDKSDEKSNEETLSPEQLVPEAEYEPSKARYHPVRDACWARGRPVPYLALARTLELVEATSARLKIVDTLANYLRSVLALTPEDLLASVYLCLNQLAPAYEGLELGVAESYLMKAVAGSTGRTLAQVRAGVAREGDLGRVAEAARAAQRTMFPAPPLTLRGVFAALQDIARTTGQASMSKKISKIQTLYVACRHSEARYLIRSLEGKLRIGLAEQSVLQALAVAVTLTPPGPGGVTQLDASKGMSPEQFKARVDANALTIKSTYCQCPHYGRLLGALLDHGVAGLPQHVRLQPGIPLKPMLAHPSKNVSHIFDRFEHEQFTCEWKYDGERAQIHVPAGPGAAPDLLRAAVFSRNQENNTSKYPDILRRLPALLKGSVTSCVLDCEAVAYDTENKQILPFQVLSTRKRKEAREEDIRVQVCVYVFDLLYLNGDSTVHRPLAERRELLREHFQETPGEWQFATSRDCTSVEEVQQFMEEAVKNSCEGLMVKALSGDQARYDIARRSHNWLKLKKDYLEGVGDTLDLVVIGAYLGRGKRAGLYGGFLLACRDADSEQFQALCKIGTGFSDDALRSLTDELRPLALDAPRPYYVSGAAPDVWLDAAAVWEVRAADLSLSPAHRAAIGRVAPDKGISLRFPRFVRARPDKKPEQATTAAQVADMYLAQDQVRNSAVAVNNYDDFY